MPASPEPRQRPGGLSPLESRALAHYWRLRPQVGPQRAILHTSQAFGFTRAEVAMLVLRYRPCPTPDTAA